MPIFRSQSGFTLIELMIVVGVIGILVSIAVPSFQKYQRKAMQSEAKLALAAIYTAEQAFYSEYAAYVFDSLPSKKAGKSFGNTAQ